MAVNQPPIKDDPAESSWDLEVTNEINRLLALIAELERRIRQLESA